MAQQFEYKITDQEGKTTTARGEAANKDAMIDSLMDKGYFVIEINEVQKYSENSGMLSTIKKLFGGGISQKEITYFYMQLSTLISAGVTLVESLESLAEQCENPKLKAIIIDMRTKISTGQTFFEAVSKYPDVFDDLTANMIKAGEAGAGLDEALIQIAKFSERDTKLRTKVKSALMYPMILSLVAGGVVFFLITYVFPKFTKVFAKAKAGLPGPTVMLMKISAFLQVYYVHVILGLVALFIGIRWLLKNNDTAAYYFDVLILKVPVVGNLILKSSVARFTRTMGTLLNGGVPILKCLEVCENIVENVLLKNVVRSLNNGVSQGIALYDILKTKKVFPSIVTKIIQTGEKTGTLPKLLIKSSDFFEYEVEMAIEGVMSMLEPVLIVVMGAVIGFIAIAMFLPMFDLTSSIK